MEVKIVIAEKNKHYTDYDCKIEKYCCEKMEEAIDEGFVKFGEFDDYPFNKNTNLNIFLCHPYPEGACWDEMPIKYCPFCGEEVKIIKQGKA